MQRVDPYHWLSDRSDPAVLEYLKAENRYTEEMTGHLHGLRKRLYEEMLGRLREDDQTVPYRKGAYWYYSRTEAGRGYRIHCRKRGTLDAPEEVVLDVNALAADKKHLEIGVLEVSPDHAWLAYSVDEEGDERYVLRFKNLETGELSPESIPNTSYSLAWSADSRIVFYDVLDEASRPYRLYRHRLGSDPSEDVLVHEEHDDRFFMSVYNTRSEAFILMDLESAVTSEVRFLDASDPEGRFTVIEPRRQGVEYTVDHQGERFLIRTNDRAVDFELYEAPIERPGRASWEVVVPHREGVTLSDVVAFERHVVLFERQEGLPQLRVLDARGGQQLIAFDEAAYDIWPGINEEYVTTTFRFGYTSLVTPDSIFHYDLETGERTLMKQEPVIGYDASRYVSERIFAASHDGTPVPISLVHRRGVEARGPAPLLLNGYGAYGSSFDPSFAAHWVSLLDRGVTIAIAHVRGGGVMGRAWKEAGKLDKKENSFKDFIACAETLVEQGYTTPDLLAISGRSAGGLLVGAVTNLRPDLFRVVIAGVPFVDVINTLLDETIPLTVVEWEEWGNPKEPAAFETMAVYSPYDNIVPQDYPHMLVLGGLNDPRVGYWEPAKLVAKLRDTKTDDNLLLLRTNLGAGHGGASGRYKRLEERAFEFAFLLDRLGINE